MNRFVLPAAAVFVLAALLIGGAVAGCDSADTQNQTNPFRILLTDAPLDDLAEAHVVIQRVELRGAEGTLVLAETPQAFDLLTLQNGVTAPLADFEVPSGSYHEVRLVVEEEARVVFTDGTEARLKVPGGTQTGIKVNLGDLVLDEDAVEITLDFDVSASFVRRGNSGKGYIFKPVVKPLTILVNGVPVGGEDEEKTGD